MLKFKITIYILFIMFSFLTRGTTGNNQTIFDFKINSINGTEINLSEFKDKSILLVNVASKCGFTKQYTDLQTLHDLYKDKGLVILGIPSNQFGNQEPSTETEIKDFCETNFNITFLMTSKYNVKGDLAHPIYLWAKESYGNSSVPKWNFHKILINREGFVEDTFASFTNPMSNKIIKQIDKVLK
jgi:glutathione peroxidase